MSKKSKSTTKKTVTVQELFQPTDFITVEQLLPGDKIQGTRLTNKVRYTITLIVRKVVAPCRDYLYYVKRFTESNLVVFVLTDDGSVLAFMQNEKIPIIRND